MSKYRLIYFDLRGRAEIPRMLFRVAGVKFEDKRLFVDANGKSTEWAAMKSSKCLYTFICNCSTHVYLLTMHAKLSLSIRHLENNIRRA